MKKYRKLAAWILAISMIAVMLGSAATVYAAPDAAPAESAEGESPEGESAEGESPADAAAPAEEAAPAGDSEGDSPTDAAAPAEEAAPAGDSEGDSPADAAAPAEEAAPAGDSEGESEGDSSEEAAPADDAAAADSEGDSAEGESADGESAEGESDGESAGDSAGSAAPTQDIILTDGADKFYEDVEWKGTDGFLALQGATAHVGGFEEHYVINEYLLPVTAKYFEASNVSFDKAVNSTFIGTQDAAGGGAVFNVTGSGSNLYVNNAYISTLGSQTAAMYMDGSTNKVVVQDSYLETMGTVEGYEAVSDFMAIPSLLAWGHTRANLSQGTATNTYYYNSVIVADGWAALSTDGATGLGVNLVAVNSYAETTDGGYALFADHECRDYIIGTTLVGAEYGSIICSGGEIFYLGGASGFQNRQELGSLRQKILETFPKVPLTLSASQTQDFTAEHPIYAMEEYMDVDLPAGRTTVVGGRNSVNMMTPDLMGQGTAASTQNIMVGFSTDFITDHELFDLNAMPEGYYTPDCVTSSASSFNPDTLAYAKWTSGPAILLRSDSAFIALDDITFTSNYDEADFGQPRTLIMSALNSDSNACLIPDGEQVAPMEIFIGHSVIDADIRDYDYHRKMFVVMAGTEFTGAIKSYTVDDWNAIWGEGGTLGTGYYAYDETYETNWWPTVALSEGSVWTVTEECFLAELFYDSTSRVIGDIEMVEGGFIVYPLE